MIVKETKQRGMLNGDNELMCDVQKLEECFFNLNERVMRVIILKYFYYLPEFVKCFRNIKMNYNLEW